MSIKYLQFITALAFLGVAETANAETVRIDNQCDFSVTVNMDGQYGCTAQAHGTCTFAASVGIHHFEARSPNVSGPAKETHQIKPGATFTWKIFLQ